MARKGQFAPNGRFYLNYILYLLYSQILKDPVAVVLYNAYVGSKQSAGIVDESQVDGDTNKSGLQCCCLPVIPSPFHPLVQQGGDTFGAASGPSKMEWGVDVGEEVGVDPFLVCLFPNEDTVSFWHIHTWDRMRWRRLQGRDNRPC